MTTLNITALRSAAGLDLGQSTWRDVAQADIDQFAQATGDNQWIHVDVERAAAGPFGTTIAHGYFTLSLASWVFLELLQVEGAWAAVNYGTDKVRFPSPVLAGSRVRGEGRILSVDEVAGGLQVKTLITIHTETGAKPACVAETLTRFLL